LCCSLASHPTAIAEYTLASDGWFAWVRVRVRVRVRVKVRVRVRVASDGWFACRRCAFSPWILLC
jgi:hypothetical protein